MTTKTRSLRNFRNPIGLLILLAAFAAAAGCSTANTTGDAVVNHVDASGNSVPGWFTPTGGLHAESATLDYIANGGSSSCTECHGSDLEGGISRVSCFGNAADCHHGGPVAGWVATPPAPQPHGLSAKKAPGSSGFASCRICHGNDFAGTPSAPSCLNNALCHGAGIVSPHPFPWRVANGSDYDHNTTNTANAPVCFGCHADSPAGNPNNPHRPLTPAAAGTPPGCLNGTMCHNDTNHPVPFNTPDHYTVTSGAFPGSCSPCHDISAPSTKIGPVCRTCHDTASPLTSLNCTSCHGSPTSNGAPTGTAYPNLAGASDSHATHIALDSAGSPVSCDTCHLGYGTGTLEHYKRAYNRPAPDNVFPLRSEPGDVAFTAAYFAKSGPSSFASSLTILGCSKVSCHGGQTTPNWRTGAIDVNTQCTDCHAPGTTEYNSSNSGEHQYHAGKGVLCIWCHNTTALAVNHFTTLADNTISPAVASATIGGPFIITWTPGSGTSGTCNAACHPGDRDW